MQESFMHPHKCSLGRRTIALAVAYLLSLQGLLVAWGVVAAAAHGGAGLPTILCTPGGASAPAYPSGEPPPCCACGPLCGSGAASALVAPTEAEFVAVLRLSVAAAWPLLPFEGTRHTSSDPRKARAPPVTA